MLSILGSKLSKDCFISSEIRISFKDVFNSNKDSLITEPNSGSKGFSPTIVEIMLPYRPFNSVFIADCNHIIRHRVTFEG